MRMRLKPKMLVLSKSNAEIEEERNVQTQIRLQKPLLNYQINHKKTAKHFVYMKTGKYNENTKMERTIYFSRVFLVPE
jgi:hypothetical protein